MSEHYERNAAAERLAAETRAAAEREDEVLRTLAGVMARWLSVYWERVKVTFAAELLRELGVRRCEELADQISAERLHAEHVP